eukprot:TRINITY_DN1985_c0_g3_i1.p1 TRINITY_DN1985_c0_g3~~TRINITY_DN1985_c0_g3_i1.p1  ORF type:complete len:522 (-),score=116.64 TRINITY_DN1985_c0_g3_i1:210-1775(-)
MEHSINSSSFIDIDMSFEFESVVVLKKKARCVFFQGQVLKEKMEEIIFCILRVGILLVIDSICRWQSYFYGSLKKKKKKIFSLKYFFFILHFSAIMIAALCWVPKGAAREQPTRFQPTEEEIQAAKQLEIEQQQQEEMTTDSHDVEAALRELQMDNYDNEDVNILGDTGAEEGGGVGDENMEGGEEEGAGEEEDESEVEDLQIKPTDLVIVTAKHEEVVSSLEVWVYEDTGEGANVYVHHDMILGSCPLCLAWMDCSPTSGTDRANTVAVGSFDPNIELWDLDVVDAIEPIGDLQGHQDAVLCLSWNKEFRNVLASGGADSTVKIWDITTLQQKQSLKYHTNKVQSVLWNENDSSVLLSGGFDKKVFLADVRQSSQEQKVSWNLNSDVESIIWHWQNPANFLVSMEDGMVQMYDARKVGEEALLSFQAHFKAATVLSMSSAVDGLLATGSVEKKTKLWDISSGSSANIITEEDLKVGAVFCGGFCRDEPWLFIAGGAKGEVSVWDIRSNQGIQNKYQVQFQ